MRNHIIVTGPESCGKTTLSKKLAEKLGAIWIPEYSRGFYSAIDRKAIAADFPHLVRASENLLDAAVQQLDRSGESPSLIVQDTGPEVLTLWQTEKFESTPLVVDAFHNSKPNLYLLCRPDLPWEPDPLREDPQRGEEFFLLFQELLANTGVPVIEVSGFGESRMESVLNDLKVYLR